MATWDKYSFVKDLSSFIKLIEKYNVPVEISELSKNEGKMQVDTSSFHLNVENIAFTIDKKISGTMPVDIELMQILFSHEFTVDESIDDCINDPVQKYDFQLHIKGYDADAKEYINWWHLDKNIVSPTPKFTHPYYHFQAGGNKIETVDTGDLILLGSPRLPHPPMDLFLGFHFVLKNFFSSKDYSFVSDLGADEEYQNIIRRSQNRMWDHYFNAFSTTTSHADFTKENIFPLYI